MQGYLISEPFLQIVTAFHLKILDLQIPVGERRGIWAQADSC